MLLSPAFPGGLASSLTMTETNEGVNNLAGGSQRTLIKLLETMHPTSLFLALEARLTSIHRAAEKGYFRKPDEQQGIKKAGIVLSRLLDIR